MSKMYTSFMVLHPGLAPAGQTECILATRRPGLWPYPYSSVDCQLQETPDAAPLVLV